VGLLTETQTDSRLSEWKQTFRLDGRRVTAIWACPVALNHAHKRMRNCHGSVMILVQVTFAPVPCPGQSVGRGFSAASVV
jgi:hypothetical protein